MERLGPFTCAAQCILEGGDIGWGLLLGNPALPLFPPPQQQMEGPEISTAVQTPRGSFTGQLWLLPRRGWQNLTDKLGQGSCLCPVFALRKEGHPIPQPSPALPGPCLHPFPAGSCYPRIFAPLVAQPLCNPNPSLQGILIPCSTRAFSPVPLSGPSAQDPPISLQLVLVLLCVIFPPPSSQPGVPL